MNIEGKVLQNCGALYGGQFTLSTQLIIKKKKKRERERETLSWEIIRNNPVVSEPLAC